MNRCYSANHTNCQCQFDAEPKQSILNPNIGQSGIPTIPRGKSMSAGFDGSEIVSGGDSQRINPVKDTFVVGYSPRNIGLRNTDSLFKLLRELITFSFRFAVE